MDVRCGEGKEEGKGVLGLKKKGAPTNKRVWGPVVLVGVCGFPKKNTYTLFCKRELG